MRPEETEDIDMSEPETIELRRYPSRKLYNKNSSSYVRLPEVAEMVRRGANIRVEDTESGEDVTRAVLLQIIMEQEGQAAGSMLSADLMMDMIRLHQSKASEMMTGLFEQSVAFIRSQQEQLASQMSTSMRARRGMCSIRPRCRRCSANTRSGSPVSGAARCRCQGWGRACRGRDWRRARRSRREVGRNAECRRAEGAARAA